MNIGAASQTGRAPVVQRGRTSFSELHSELSSRLSDIDRTSVKLSGPGQEPSR